ncbi:MAG: hypothetical protein ACPGXL_10045, partial [Chitinophagales bacterium]
ALSGTKEGKKSQHIIVFNIVLKNNITNNAQLEVFLKEKEWYKNISRIKNYIYENLLDYLVYHHRKRLEAELGYRAVLKNEILKEKGLQEIAYNNSRKLATEATQNNKPLLTLIHLNDAYRGSIRQSMMTPALLEEALVICDQIENNIFRLTEYYNYISLNLKIMKILTNEATSHIEKKQSAKQLLTVNLLLQYPKDFYSPFNYIFYTDCLQRIYEFLENHTFLIPIIEYYYQKLLGADIKDQLKHNLLYQFSGQLSRLYTHVGDKGNFTRIMKLELEHFNKAGLDTGEFLVRMRLFRYIRFLNFAFYNQDYTIGIDQSKEIIHFLSENKAALNDNEKVHVLFRLATCYWGRNDYEKVVEILEGYLNFNKLPNYVGEYVVYRLLLCIAQIDMGHPTLAKTQCRTLLYYKQKKVSWVAFDAYSKLTNKLLNLINILIAKGTNRQIQQRYEEISEAINQMGANNDYKKLFRLWVVQQMG